MSLQMKITFEYRTKIITLQSSLRKQKHHLRKTILL